ncbi:hypothetical protein ABN056_08045 [Providencia vermicola]|uniref:hypothetical protein n=1 Tax=Providencia vermicola TaxID=333965 RepID=UPI0032DB4051
MRILSLNDEEYSLLQNILNNFVLHGVESIPNDDSCNVLKMNDRINELKNVEPVGYITPVSKLLLRRKQKAFIYPEKTETNIPLYRLD